MTKDLQRIDSLLQEITRLEGQLTTAHRQIRKLTKHRDEAESRARTAEAKLRDRLENTDV